jgi:hypothetical protein
MESPERFDDEVSILKQTVALYQAQRQNSLKFFIQTKKASQNLGTQYSVKERNTYEAYITVRCETWSSVKLTSSATPKYSVPYFHKRGSFSLTLDTFILMLQNTSYCTDCVSGTTMQCHWLLLLDLSSKSVLISTTLVCDSDDLTNWFAVHVDMLYSKPVR